MAKNYFVCCQNCTPPKRCSGCHSTCAEYLQAKALYDAEAKAAKSAKLLENVNYYYHRAMIAPRIERRMRSAR